MNDSLDVLTVPPATFDANTFARGWQSIALARSKDDARPALCGLCVEFFPDGVQLVATDSYMLLRSFVPNIHGDGNDAPLLDEAPIATAVALDWHGRADSLMRHLIDVTSGKEAVPVELEVGVGPDPRPTDEPALIERAYLTLEVAGQEIQTLMLYEGVYPTWRKVIAEFAPQMTDQVSFMPELVVARLGKLGKLHKDAALTWRFGGAIAPAAIEIVNAKPSLSGLVMPVRVHLPDMGPEPTPDDEDQDEDQQDQED